jgi:CBS domain-containing protein
MKPLTVRDVMNLDPVTVTTRTPFKDLVAVLAGKRLNAVLVVSRRGEVAGIVTEADLLRKQGLQPAFRSLKPVTRAYRARWSRATGVCAGEVMTTRPVTIRPDATLGEAARLMEQRHCPCLPVTDPAGKLVGTVTARDLLQVFLRPDNQIMEDVCGEILAGRFAAAAGSLTVDVSEGVVTVSGEVQCKSMLPLVLAVIRGVDGVVDVEGQLTWASDDSRQPAFQPRVSSAGRSSLVPHARRAAPAPGSARAARNTG